MNRKIARRVIAKIAKREGIRVSEVREEMSKAIVKVTTTEKQGGNGTIFSEKIQSPLPKNLLLR